MYPKLRFKEFSDAWEQRKVLNEVNSIDTGKSKFEAKESGEFEILGSTGVIGYDDSYDYEGDFLLTARVGANAGTLYRHSGKVKITDNTVFLQGNHIDFIFYLLDKFDLKKMSFGSGQPLIKASEVKSLELQMPTSNEEKEKIAEYFLNLDNLITLHQRQCETLKKQKQFFLQNMFPKEGESSPKIRFKGFSDSWKQCKLHEICSMNARIGWQNLRTSEFLDSGDYLLITGTDFVNGKVNFKSCHYVDKYRFDQDLKIQVQNGSILITKDGTLGKVAIIEALPKPATLNAGVFNVVIKSKDIDNYYLYQYLKAPFLMNYVNKRSTGGTIKHLNQSILVDFPVLKPSLQEQQKIGAYFERLDNLITLHQRQYEQLVSLKKYLLTKMFI